MKTKKFLSLALSALLILSAIPFASFVIGAESSAYDVTGTFSADSKATVNGEEKNIDDVFELLTMTADSVSGYAYADGQSLSDFADENGLTLPLSRTANESAGTQAAVNLLKLKDSVAGGRALQSISYDIDSTRNMFNRDNGSGVAFAYSTSEDTYTISKLHFLRADTGIQTPTRLLSKTVYSFNGNANNNAFGNGISGTNDSAEIVNNNTTVFYFSVKLTFGYTEDVFSNVKLEVNIYQTAEDRAAKTNPAATFSGTMQTSNNTDNFKSDSLPCFAYTAGSAADYNKPIKNLTVSYAKNSDDIAADNQKTADEFAANNSALLNSAVTEENAAQFIALHKEYSAFNDEVKALLSNYNGTDYGALVTEKYNEAVVIVPTAASEAFKNYYNANVSALASFDGNLNIANEALSLYGAVEETHKPIFKAEYAKIASLLDNYFIKNNTFEFKMTEDEKSANPYVYNYFKTSVMAANSETGRKHIDFGKFNAKDMKRFTLAMKYYPDSTVVNSTNYGFNILPENLKIPEGLTDNSSNKTNLIWSVFRSKWPNSDNSNRSLQYNIADYQKATTTVVSKDGGWTTNTMSVPNDVNNENLTKRDGIYMYKGDRVVFDVTLTPTLTTKDGQNAIRYLITLYAFVEDSANDATATPYKYDKDVDILMNGGNTGCNLFVKYDTEVPYFYFTTNDVTLDYVEYFSAESNFSFADKYANVLSGNDTNADNVLAMYSAFGKLSDSDKALYEANVESALTNSGVRPKILGATLRADGIMDMVFMASKPDAAVSSAYVSNFGMVIAGYQNMVDANVNKLVRGNATAGSFEDSVAYKKGDTVDNDLKFTVKGIDFTNINYWKTKIAARAYVVYNVDGTEVTVYSNNELTDSLANPSNAAGIDNNGVCIRNVNGIVTKLVSAFLAKADVNGDTVGVALADTTVTTKYEGVKLSENADFINQMKTDLSKCDRVEVYKFLSAYRNVLNG